LQETAVATDYLAAGIAGQLFEGGIAEDDRIVGLVRYTWRLTPTVARSLPMV
jgi:hypothetical protein